MLLRYFNKFIFSSKSSHNWKFFHPLTLYFTYFNVCLQSWMKVYYLFHRNNFSIVGWCLMMGWTFVCSCRLGKYFSHKSFSFVKHFASFFYYHLVEKISKVMNANKKTEVFAEERVNYCEFYKYYKHKLHLLKRKNKHDMMIFFWF